MEANDLKHPLFRVLTFRDGQQVIAEDVKTEVQGDVDALKTALAGDDDDAVKTAFDKLNASQGKLGEAIYASSQAAGEQADPNVGQPGNGETPNPEEDVIDAEVVDDENPDEKK